MARRCTDYEWSWSRVLSCSHHHCTERMVAVQGAGCTQQQWSSKGSSRDFFRDWPTAGRRYAHACFHKEGPVRKHKVLSWSSGIWRPLYCTYSTRWISTALISHHWREHWRQLYCTHSAWWVSTAWMPHHWREHLTPTNRHRLLWLLMEFFRLMYVIPAITYASANPIWYLKAHHAAPSVFQEWAALCCTKSCDVTPIGPRIRGPEEIETNLWSPAMGNGHDVTVLVNPYTYVSFCRASYGKQKSMENKGFSLFFNSVLFVND